MTSKNILIQLYKDKSCNLTVIHKPKPLRRSIHKFNLNQNDSTLKSDYLDEYFSSPHNSIKHSQSASYMWDKSTKNASLNESHDHQRIINNKKHFYLPSIGVRNRANEIITNLLSKSKMSLKKSNYHKKEFKNHVYEKAYSHKVLQLTPKKKLASNKILEECYGNEMLLEEGIDKLKFIMENKKYKDIDLINWDKLKSKDLKKKFGIVTNKKELLFGFNKEKQTISKNTRKIQRIFNTENKLLSFDEQLLNRIKQCNKIINNIKEHNKTIMTYKQRYNN